MNTPTRTAASNLALAPLLLALAGCGTSAGYKQADKTGESINSLRNDVAQLKAAVDGSMKALDSLQASASTNPRKAYEAYAKSVNKVESSSEKVKKQADEMRERGQAYFQQWETQLASVKNEEIRTLAQERRAKLQETFDTIKNVAQDAKSSFPPFLADLKDLRTALGADLTVEGVDAAKNIFQKTKSAGVEVQKHLDSLAAELNSVVAAITAHKASSN
jgi:hypothetical protein